MALTIASTADSLNIHTREYATDLKQIFRQGLEFENMLTPRATDKMWVAPNASVGSLVQPYQWQFTPTGTPVFDAVENELQPIKIDILITEGDLEKFWDSWNVSWFESGKPAEEWTFPRYLYEQVYLPKILEEMNTNAWSGEYAAPTPGTAGASLTSVDGYKIKIEDAITAGTLTEYSSGALVASTMVNQVESWVDSLPTTYRDAAGSIYMSPTRAKQYYRDFRDKFGAAQGTTGNENRELIVEMTNKRIVPINAMEGSDRWIFCPASTDNMIWVTRRGFATYPVINWQPYERSIKGMATVYRAYGFDFWGHVMVNDQE